METKHVKASIARSLYSVIKICACILYVELTRKLSRNMACGFVIDLKPEASLWRSSAPAASRTGFELGIARLCLTVLSSNIPEASISLH